MSETHGKKRRASPDEAERGCSVSGCERPVYAKGLCQTHYRQQLKTGRTRPIRRYRQRSDDTVKFAGLRLSRHCADLLERRADSQGISRGAVIAQVLEQWVAERKRRGR
jgi:hypothetical protein